MDSFMNHLWGKELSDQEKIALVEKNQKEEQKSKEAAKNETLYISLEDVLDARKLCNEIYLSEIWEKLTEESRENIQDAYIEIAFKERFKKVYLSNESGPIHKMGLTVEYEFKHKIFIDFINSREIGVTSSTNRTGQTIINCVQDVKEEEPFICLGDMLRIIKESLSNKNTKSIYARELRDYLKEKGWNVNSLSSEGKKKGFYLNYSRNYRNPSSHTYLKGKEKTLGCQSETREALKWILSAYNGPQGE